VARVTDFNNPKADITRPSSCHLPAAYEVDASATPAKRPIFYSPRRYIFYALLAMAVADVEPPDSETVLNYPHLRAA